MHLAFHKGVPMARQAKKRVIRHRIKVTNYSIAKMFVEKRRHSYQVEIVL